MDSRKLLALLACATLFTSCATRDRDHRMVISVPEQRMVVFKNNEPIAEYPVSTSKFCLSDAPGSRGTPLGELEIAKKIGANAPLGMKFHNRRATGEIVAPDAPGRDPIVSRILWLRGLQQQNRHAYGRYIYIHGTAEEAKIGEPASFGCIRMKSTDVIQLFNTVGIGARVEIVNQPFAQAAAAAVATGG
ncbi:MAG: hypothetical protein QOD99_541 [Chthoniobacter sp.]|jgi:hypothetical protein|nr:hypothetical protein [Chthoniobacter sp.]